MHRLLPKTIHHRLGHRVDQHVLVRGPGEPVKAPGRDILLQTLRKEKNILVGPCVRAAATNNLEQVPAIRHDLDRILVLNVNEVASALRAFMNFAQKPDHLLDSFKTSVTCKRLPGERAFAHPGALLGAVVKGVAHSTTTPWIRLAEEDRIGTLRILRVHVFPRGIAEATQH